MISEWFIAYPWSIRKGRELPPEFKRYLSDPELSGDSIGGHVHWSVMAGPIAITVTGLVIVFGVIAGLPANAGTLGSLAVLAVPALCIYFIWELIEWRRDMVFITGKRVITVTGVIARDVSMLPLGKLTDMTYTRSIVGLILGYGQFRMETAGQNQAVEMLKHIPDSDFTYRYVQNLLFGRGTTDVILVDVKTEKKVNVNWRGKLKPDSEGRLTRIEPADESHWYD